MAFEVGSIVAHIKADLTDFKAGIAEAKSEASGFGSHLQDIGSGIMAFSKQAAVVSAVAAGGIALMGKNALDSAEMFQNARLSFNAMLGDEKKAAELMIALSEEAKKSAFTIPDVIAGAKQLTAYGFQGTKEIVDTLDMVGNVAYAVKAPLQDVVYVYGTLRAQGRAYTRDIIQFAQRGIPIWDELSKVMKVPVNEVQKLVEAGQVGFPQVEEAFKNMTAEGGKFNKAMSQPTLALTLSNISDAFTRLGAAFLGVSVTGEIVAGGLFDKISQLSAAFLYFANNAGPAFTDFGSKIGAALSSIITFLEPVGAWIVANKDIVIPFFTGLTAAIAGILVLAPLIVIAFNPFLLTFTAIAVAAGILYTAWQTNFGGIRDITISVVTEIVNFFNNYLMPAISFVTAFIAERWQFIILITTSMWEIIKGIFEMAWAIIYTIIKVGLALMVGDWGKAWDAIKSGIDIFYTGFNNFLNGIIDGIRGWGGLLVHELVQPFQDAWNKISDFLAKIKDGLDFTKRHSPSVVDIVKKGVGQVNKAMAGLDFAGMVSPNINPATVMNGATSSNVTSVSIDMNGAYIGDMSIASRLGEQIGDSIIKKLEKNIRF